MSVENSRKTNLFNFYAYYGLPGKGRPVRSKKAEKQLLDAMASFTAAHLTKSRAKYKIEGMFSSGGFIVYGLRKASLAKLPEKFEDFTRVDIREMSHYEYAKA